MPALMKGLVITVATLLAANPAKANPAEPTLLECETTVEVGDGKLTIELWPWAAPAGVTWSNVNPLEPR